MQPEEDAGFDYQADKKVVGNGLKLKGEEK